MLNINFASTKNTVNDNKAKGLSLTINQNIEFSAYGFANILKKETMDDVLKDLSSKLPNFKAAKFSSIVVLGIGGSSLGIKVILRALLAPQARNHIYILENIDPDYIDEVNSQIVLPSTLFIVISKSGQTPETISQYSYYKSKIQEANLSLSDHVLIITDPKDGYLRQEATTNNLTNFSIPPDVGGRFSVLTPVGLVISYLSNIDCKELLLGASDYLKSIQEKENIDYIKYALAQFNLAELNHNINVLMPYSNQLEYLADWYVQLLGESIGKKINLNNQIVNVGITPLKALGCSDQHSQLQLFSEGPKDKLITFIQIENFKNQIIIPNISDDKLNYLSQVTFGDLLNSELEGTRESLAAQDVPNILIRVNQINEYNLGQLFIFFELTIVVLGELYNINPFDQPGVEQSKVLTKATILKSKK